MAIVYPLANGNWSSVSNWYTSGATYNQLPQAGDDVYADGKTIVIDVDITVNLLTTTQRAGGTLGGVFTCSTARTIIANTIQGYQSGLNLTCTGIIQNVIATNLLAYTYNQAGYSTISIGGTSGTVNISATSITNDLADYKNIIINGSGNILNLIGSIPGAYPVLTNSTGIVNFSGNVKNGVNLIAPINQTGVSGVVNITGTLYGGNSSGGYCVYNNFGTVNVLSNQTMSGSTGIGVQTVNGVTNFGTVGNPVNIYGATSSAASGFYISNLAGGGVVNFFGNIIQQNYGWSTTVGLFNHSSTSGIMNIYGNVNGGSVLNTIGVSNSSTGTINIVGNISGGTHASNTPAIYSTTAGIINVTGNTISNLYPAIYSTNALATHRLYGNLVSANGIFPIYSTNPLSVRISPSNSQTIVLQDSNNVSRSFDTSNATTGLPAASNVRRGISYGITNQYTGTMYVPTPDNVRKDVLTDNTVGTADLSVTSLINTLTGSSNPMAVRLRNVSTAQITGSQIAGLLNNP